MNALMPPSFAPAPPAPSVETTAQDLEHLRLLSIFHYVAAAVTAACSLLPAVHLVIGIAMVRGKMDAGNPDAAIAGWFFIGFAALLIAFGLTFAGFTACAGRCLRQRRRYTLCLVVAAQLCMMMPFGTVLGVFTLIALTKPSVKALFADA